MATDLEDLRILQIAESVADEVWKRVVVWDIFARDVVGGQLARAVDSVGANIAEAFGRYHYGEKLQFLYYARGSLFETKYWLSRAVARRLLPASDMQDYARCFTDLARQLNAFAGSLKDQKRADRGQGRSLREPAGVHARDAASALFAESELEWLLTTGSPVSDL